MRAAVLATLIAGCASAPIASTHASAERATAERSNGMCAPLIRSDVARYVDGVGQRLIGASRLERHWWFHVVDRPEPNGYAVSGGRVYVTRGALIAMGSEDELAALLAHEIGHGIAEHEVGAIDRALLDRSQGREYRSADRREVEREADAIAARLLAHAGFDPGATAAMLQALERGAGGANVNDESHPPLAERIARASELGTGAGARYVQRYLEAIAGLEVELAIAEEHEVIDVPAGVVVDLPDGWSIESSFIAPCGTRLADGPHGERLSIVPFVMEPVHALRQAGDVPSEPLEIDGLTLRIASVRRDEEWFSGAVLVQPRAGVFFGLFGGGEHALRDTLRASLHGASDRIGRLTVVEVEPGETLAHVRERACPTAPLERLMQLQDPLPDRYAKCIAVGRR